MASIQNDLNNIR